MCEDLSLDLETILLMNPDIDYTLDIKMLLK